MEDEPEGAKFDMVANWKPSLLLGLFLGMVLACIVLAVLWHKNR